MNMRFLNGSILALALGITSYAEAARDPVGETANYGIVRGSRTSSIISSGTMTGTVTEKTVDDQGQTGYNISIDYSFTVFGSNHAGTQPMGVPEGYFTGEVMNVLRTSRDHVYTTPLYKLEWKGQEDITTAAGETYTSCDIVRIYDVQTQVAGSSPLANLAAQMLGAAEANDIQDLEIIAHIHDGIPVLGAATLDVSGKYSGFRVKAGADYQP